MAIPKKFILYPVCARQQTLPSLRIKIDCGIVPGIEDNPALGVRRGKLRMTGAEIAAIFRPVVQVSYLKFASIPAATQYSLGSCAFSTGSNQNCPQKDHCHPPGWGFWTISFLARSDQGCCREDSSDAISKRVRKTRHVIVYYTDKCFKAGLQ